eukprot:CAMPEP_0119424010 /NCGR_PEP_ID=MMETSP1335-20130426/31627_1 /TAXON_ID=259385 /ORGANISM="Chrysoculter rhomboideus, Strain RCC1486" /LENGTH=440 /DNA_ID=CAMNT_0007449521 /DNA_START=213 /DNA_END=1531 /DNA_ORIENTATION=-
MSELWVLTCAPGSVHASWSQLPVAGASPPGRCSHVAAVLADEERILVFGGEGGTGTLNDLAVLGLRGETDASAKPAADERIIYRDETLAEVEEATEKVTLTRRERAADPVGPPLALRWLHVFTPPSSGSDAGERPTDAEATWPSARREHAGAALFDGGLLIHGGSEHGLDALGDVWICRFVADGQPRWQSPECAGECPPPSAGHTATAVGVRVLLAGGALLDAAHVLDSVAMTWTRLLAQSELLARTSHAALASGHGVLLFGGVDALTDEELLSAARITLSEDATVAPLGLARSSGKVPRPRSGLCAARAGGIVYLLGGRGSDHLGELVCCKEDEGDTARREQEEAELAEEAQSVRKERRLEQKAAHKQRQAEEKRRQQAVAAEEAARRKEEEQRANDERDIALKERGEALAAQVREEQRRKAKEARDAKDALKASRTGG